MLIARTPTAVERAPRLSRPGTELWIKRDDRTHEVYGGNKVRKLQLILDAVLGQGARRIVTVGAAGSHHVLASAYFGGQAGLEVEAVLVPQKRTAHVVDNLRAALGLGLRAFPVGSRSAAGLAVARRVVAGARFVPLGGSSVVGAMGYVTAARELAAQVRAGELPEPDVLVVALGSGGTAAGLAAGLDAEGLSTRVVGVCISEPVAASRIVSRWLTRACAQRAIRSRRASTGCRGDPPLGDFVSSRGGAQSHLSMDARFLGAGYGYSTLEGDAATRDAAEQAGLVLDPTYTAKAFACALWHVRARQARHVLYWHTLSSAPMGPLLEDAPEESALDAHLRALLV